MLCVLGKLELYVLIATGWMDWVGQDNRMNRISCVVFEVFGQELQEAVGLQVWCLVGRVYPSWNRYSRSASSQY